MAAGLLIPCICNLWGKWESVCFRWVKCCPWCFLVRNPGLWEALSVVGPLKQVRLPVTPHCPCSQSSDTFGEHNYALAFPKDGRGSPGHGDLVPADGKPCSSCWEWYICDHWSYCGVESYLGHWEHWAVTWNLPAALKFCVLVWHQLLLIQPLDELWGGDSDCPQRMWSHGVWVRTCLSPSQHKASLGCLT